MTGAGGWGETGLAAATRPLAVGDRLRAIRMARGIGAHDLCAAIRLDPLAYPGWEAGRRVLPVHVAWLIADRLGVDLNWLLAGDDRLLSAGARAALDLDPPPDPAAQPAPAPDTPETAAP